MCKFITTDASSAFAEGKKYVVAIGVFDGVHRGHKSVVETACRLAAECGALPGALTFSPHPKAVVSADGAPLPLTSVARRIGLLREAGASGCGIINFTVEIAALEAEDFLDRLLNRGGFELAGICVGTQWRFGKNGRGDRRVLEKFSRENEILFEAVPEMEYDGILISSTAVRQAAAAGELEKVSGMLGRRYSFCGRVVHGMSVAGSKLDAPTANLEITEGVLPPPGVYAGDSSIDGKTYPAAVSIGSAPTFDVERSRVEVHLIGFSGDLYGREIEVSLNSFLRGIRKFASADELKDQIAADIAGCVELQKRGAEGDRR